MFFVNTARFGVRGARPRRIVGLHGRMPCAAPANCVCQEKTARCCVFREYSSLRCSRSPPSSIGMAGCHAQHQQTAFAKKKRHDVVFFVNTARFGVRGARPSVGLHGRMPSSVQARHVPTMKAPGVSRGIATPRRQFPSLLLRALRFRLAMPSSSYFARDGRFLLRSVRRRPSFVAGTLLSGSAAPSSWSPAEMPASLAQILSA